MVKRTVMASASHPVARFTMPTQSDRVELIVRSVQVNPKEAKSLIDGVP
jgi:hypothetical protein